MFTPRPIPLLPARRPLARFGLCWLLVLLAGLRGAEARGTAPRVSQPSRKVVVLAGSERIRPGDLVFRRGISLISNAVLVVDDATYSHVGMAIAAGSAEGSAAGSAEGSAEGSGIAVVHAAPGENPGDPEPIHVEPLTAFLAPAKASAAAVYRPAGDPAIAAAAAHAAEGYFTQRLSFDGRFSLASENELYCTELVWRAYLAAGVELLDRPARRIDNLLIRGPVILPSDLASSSKLQLLLIFETKENPDVRL